MSLSKVIRSLFVRAAARTVRNKPTRLQLALEESGKRRAAFRLSPVEALEERAVPATISWNNTATTWADGGNWVGGVAPADSLTTDVANFDLASYSNGDPATGTTSITGITVGSASAALTIGGTNLSIGASGVTVASGAGAVSLSPATLTLGAAQGWTNNSANLLTVGAGTVTNGGNLLTIGGTGNTTVSGALGNGSGGLTKSGAGTLVLSGTNTYTGTTTINAGALILQNPSAGLTQTLGNLTLAGADVTLESDYNSGSGTLSTTFGSLTARVAGNSANIKSTGGVNGTSNLINLTQGVGFIDKGVFFNGSSYAAMNAANTYVTGLVYDGNNNTAVTDTVTASKHVQITATPANQGAIALLSLNLAGSGFNFVNNGSTTLTVPAILKSGGSSASIFGGNFVTAGASTELVVRTNAASDLLNIYTAVSGTSSPLTKSGDGTLMLGAANTYTGATFINGGTLAIGDSTHAGQLGSGTYTSNIFIASGATLKFDSSAAQILQTGVISGGGGITKFNTGNLTLSGNNTYTGGFTLNAGTVVISSGTYTGFGTGTLTINGGTISVASGTATTANNSIWNGNFTLPNQNKTWIHNGDVTLGGNISVTGGGNTANLTVNGVISETGGSRSLTQNVGSAQAQAWTFTNANTYSGGTILNATGANSTLNINNASAIGTGKLTISGNSVFLDNTTANPITLTTNNLQDWGNSFTFNGTRSLNMGTGAVNLTGGTRTVTVTANSFTVGGVISNGGITKAGAGTLVLSGSASNTYGTLTTVNAGTLQLDKSGTANAIAAGGLSVATGATVTYTGSSTDMIANAAPVTVTGTGQLNLNGVSDTIGTLGLTAVAANNALVTTGAGTLTLGGTVTFTAATTGTAQISGNLALGGATRDFNVGLGTSANQDLFVNAVISGAILTKSGAGRLTLSGANTYNGGTTISAGALQFANTAAMPATGAVAVGAGTTLAVNAGAASAEFTNATSGNGSIGGLLAGLGGQVGGTVTYAGNVTLGIDTTNAVGGTMTYSGVIGNVGGTLGLTKLGAGTLVLDQANTYSGLTTISAGTLNANASAALGSGNLVFNGGALQAAGTITSPSTRQVFMTGAGAIDTNGNAVSIAGVIGGTGNLTKSGADTLTLSGANTFTGTTTVSAGILSLANVLALQNSVLQTTNSIAGDASNGLRTTQSTLTLGGLTGNKNFASTGGVFTTTSGGYGSVTNLTLNPASGVTNTYSGAIEDGATGMTVTNSGAGTQVLQGASIYSGATFVNAGRLELSGNGSILNSAITFNGGELRLTNTAAETGSGRVSNSASITSNGGTLTYNNTSGAIVYAETIGSVALNSGLMNFNLANNQTGAGSQTLTLSGLTQSGSGAVVFSANTTAPNATKNRIQVSGATTPAGQIIGPWATTGTAADSQNDYAAYDASGFIVPANIAASAETTWTTAANAYTLSTPAKTATALTATRNITALKVSSTATATTSNTVNGSPNFTISSGHSFAVGDPVVLSSFGGDLTNFNVGRVYYVAAVTGTTFTLAATPGGAAINAGAAQSSQFTGGLKLDSGINLGTTGILNSGNAPLAIGRTAAGGNVTLPTAGAGNLYITTGLSPVTSANSGLNGRISIEAPIVDNGGALTLVKNGAGVLRLQGANTYTGGTVINAGTVIFTDGNSGANFGTAGITFNGSGALSFGPNNSWAFASGGTVNLSRPITLNNGAIAGFYYNSPNTTMNITGAITGDGGVTVGKDPVVAYAGGDGTIVYNAFSSTGHTFTGPLIMTSGHALTFNSLADGSGPMILGANFTYGSGAIASMSAPNRLVDVRGNVTITNSAGSSHTVTLGNVSTTTSGAKTLTFSNANTNGAGFITGNITNGAGTVGLTKSGTGALTLSGSNSYTDATTISAGTLQIGAGGTTGSLNPSSTISNAGTLIFNRTNTVTQGSDFANTISGTGGVTQNGTGGTLVLSGTNNYTGNTTVNAGTLRLDSLTAIQNSPLNTTATGVLSLNAGAGIYTLGGLAGSTNLATVITGNPTDLTALTLNPGTGLTPSYSGVIGDLSTGMSVRKSGVGTQTLSGNNSFTGGLVVNAGTLRLSGAQSFTGGVTLNGGTFGDNTDTISAVELNNNSITVSGTASMGITNGETLTSSSGILINSSGVLTMGAASNGAATVSGVLSGTGAFVLGDAVGAGQGNAITFSNTANTFTGGVRFNPLTNGGYALNVNSLADSATPGAGNIVMGNGGAISSQTFALHTGAVAPLTLTNRQFELQANASGQTLKIANNSGQAFTINSDLNASAATGAKTLRLGGGGAGLSTFAGTITNGGLTTLNLTKEDSASTWVLSGANTYNGVTTIGAGILQVTELADGGASSSIGASTNAASNLLFGTGARLRYVGAGDSTNRSFTINGTAAGHSAILDASGTGAIDFTNSATPGYGTNNQTRTLTLTGSNDGANTLAAVLTNNGSGALSVSKSSPGRWVLSSTNTYTGTTTINAGVVQAADGVGLPTSSILEIRGGVFQSSGTFTRSVGTAAGNVNWSTSSGGFAAIGAPLVLNLNGGTGSLTWNGSSFVQTGQTLIFGSTSADNLVDFQNAINLGSSGTNTRTVTVIDNPSSSTDRARISGAITNTVAGQSLLKDGNGILELTNTNTYSGGTTVGAGMLSITGTGSINNTSGVSIGTGIFNYSSTTALMQPVTFSGTGGTLSGTGGTIDTDVTVTSGNTLAPGSSVGTLNFGLATTDLTLNSGSFSTFEITGNAAADNYDKIVGNGGTLTYGGTLDVSFLTTTPTLPGTYSLFSGFAVISGTFSSIDLPPAPSGLAWHDYGSGVLFDYATGQIQLEVAATQLVVTAQPVSTTYGTAVTFTVETRDGNNVLVPGTNQVTISVANSAFVNSTVTSLNAMAGVASFTVYLGAGNSVQLTAMASGMTSASSSVFTIAKKDLNVQNVTANSRPYNSTTAATGAVDFAVLNGAVFGDSVAIDIDALNNTPPTFAFADPNVGTSKPVTVDGFVLANANAAPAVYYNLVQPIGVTADITPAILSISLTGATADNKIYDRTTNVTFTGTPAADLSGVYVADLGNVVLNGTPTYAFEDKNVGTDWYVLASGLSISGSASGNYSLPGTNADTDAQANITQKGLTIAGITANDKVFDGNATATVSGTPTLVGVISPDVVNLGGTPSYNFNDPTVGNGKPVTASGFTIGGADSGNYSLSQPAGLTANITSAQPAPTVTSVVPFIGPTTGGNVVVITGTNFDSIDPGHLATAVTFNAVNATNYTVNDATQITATAPAGAAATINVVVTNPGGSSASDATDGTTGTTANDYTYATPSLVSVVINGGDVVARNRFGGTPSLANQNSVVSQILVTFNMRVNLDADAFAVSSLAGSVSSQGIAPSPGGAAVVATPVSGTGNGTDGYTQYVLTFSAGSGVNSFNNGVSPNVGNSFTTLKDGFFSLNLTGAKVHAGVSNTGADDAEKFWVLYGAVNPGDIKINGELGDTVTDTLLVDGLALNDIYSTFGSSAQTPAGPPIYRVAFDWNVDGNVDGVDLTHLYTNFGTVWKF